MTLRVLIASNVRIVQEGVQAVLVHREGVEVVGTADLHAAGRESARLEPDVILFDAARREGLEQVREVVSALPRSRVVAFGVKESGEDIVALAAAGTAGYVRDSATGGELLRVLERVMADELPCSARTAASLYRQVARLSRRGGGADPDASAWPRQVSRRELEVAQLVDRGLSNKQIGRELGIEAATVKNHVHNLCAKLKVHRRGQLVPRIRAILPMRLMPPSAAPGQSHPPQTAS